MTIRAATADDTPALVKMGERFIAETAYREAVACHPGQLEALLGHVLQAPDGAVLVADQQGTPTGMVGLIVGPHPYSGERVGFELFWWMEPETRGRGVALMRAAEDWARAHGATRMQMVAPNAKVAHFYERVGYRAVETAYQREL